MKTMLGVLGLVVTSTATVACSDSTGSDAVVTVSAIVGGDGQSALVGTTLPRPLQIQVRSDDVAAEGAVVVWEPSSGSLTLTSSATDSNGIAAVRWTLGAAPGAATVTATVAGATGSSVVFKATALGWVTATVDPSTDNQAGVVGGVLPMPLRITAFAAGAPAEGVAFTWSTTDGTITPRLGTTDRHGVGTATWNLPLGAGPLVASVVLERTAGPPLTVHATARPGPAIRMDKLRGDGQVVPANFPEFGQLVVDAADAYGNTVPTSTLHWSVVSGPVELLPREAGTPESVARIAPTGTAGAAVVRASIEGSPLFANFALTVGPPVPLVIYDANARTFTSAQNGSLPAVDTIPVGGSMTWVARGGSYWDGMGVLSVGSPGFLGGEFSYGEPSTFTAVFSPLGSYQYVDYYPSQTSGTVVVR